MWTPTTWTPMDEARFGQLTMRASRRPDAGVEDELRRAGPREPGAPRGAAPGSPRPLASAGASGCAARSGASPRSCARPRRISSGASPECPIDLNQHRLPSARFDSNHRCARALGPPRTRSRGTRVASTNPTNAARTSGASRGEVDADVLTTDIAGRVNPQVERERLLRCAQGLLAGHEVPQDAPSLRCFGGRNKRFSLPSLRERGPRDAKPLLYWQSP